MATEKRAGRDMSAALFGGDPMVNGSDDDGDEGFNARDLPQAPDWLVNSAAGFGDAATLGASKKLRELWDIRGGLAGGIQSCSPAYLAGDALGMAAGKGRLGYAGLAKIGATRAVSGAAASAYRDMLKKKFRLGLSPNWRKPNLNNKTDAELRASAGRTNIGMNLYGGALAAVGLGNIADCVLGQSPDTGDDADPILPNQKRR
jgi:hypothetical protein